MELSEKSQAVLAEVAPAIGMDETLRAAIVLGNDRKQRLKQLRMERDLLMFLLDMPPDAQEVWWVQMPEKTTELAKARLEAMRKAAYDKATELLGIEELERYE